MVHEQKLSAVLSEFARTLITDFPIQGLLEHLVERIVEVLPVTAAGVTLIDAGLAPRYVAASDESAMRFERLQTEIGEGPCLLAYESGDAIAIPDLGVDGRFPNFGPAALAAGVAAVFTFPLRHGDGRLGALDLYRDTPGRLDAHNMAAAQTLADVAAAYLINAESREEARRTADYFRHSALHDSLTGLPNRLLLEQRLEHAAQRAQRSHSNAAVLFADLDRFKAVNDTHGHQVGDELLLAVAHRLAALARPGDTLARFSGDEFVFLCEDLHSAADVEILAARIAQAFESPFAVAGLTLAISASVGMAFAGPGEDISNDLVAKADIAMYQAKRARGGTRSATVIDLRDGLQTTDRSSLERDLRAAVTEERLDVAFQPIVRSADGTVTGVEALLRWTHPIRGPIAAQSMIGIAEQTGLINMIGSWVLERSCRERVAWLQAYPAAPLDLAVNVSGRQLMSADFSSMVASILARTGMDPAALVLEITENMFIEDSDRAMKVLADLKALGVRLALDDFGTGFSSLSYLHRLPVDIVKIDQGFIAEIGQAPTGGAIVAAVTDLAHVFGLAVTAEGVETCVQRDKVREIGCEFAQGYLFARPMPAAAIAELLGRQTVSPLRLPTELPTAASGL
jgi:diguanylate cyclase (GGDEF)-like protein